MATVNFSVPAEIKRAFNETFAKENKSAIIARLMKQEVELRRLRARRIIAIEKLKELRAKAPAVSLEEVNRILGVRLR